MLLQTRTTGDYAQAIADLLPPGAAFAWPPDGFGFAVLAGTAQELARIDGQVSGVLDSAVDAHRPKFNSWHIGQYRRIAADAVVGMSEALPRATLAVGSHVGDRLWSINGPSTTFAVPLVQVDHLLRPLRVGSRVGDNLWSSRVRYFLRVRYYRSVVDPEGLWWALDAFKQAHVFLWFEDITGSGGGVSYA